MKLTVRLSILTIMTLLVLITGSVIIAISYLGGKDSVYFLSDNMMKEITKSVTDKTINYLNSATKNNNITKFLFTNEFIDLNNWDDLTNYFQNVLKTNEEINSGLYGNTEGSSVVVRRMADNTISARLDIRTEKEVTSTWIHQNKEYKDAYPNTVKIPEKGYDCRTKTWYKNGLGTTEGKWTEIYVSATDKNIMLEHSVSIYEKQTHKLKGVCSYIMNFFKMSYFLGNLKIGNMGKAFIINNNYEIAALPIKNEQEIGKKLLRKVTDEKGKDDYKFYNVDTVEDKDIANSILEYKKMKENNKLEEKVFEYSFKGKKYLALFTPFPEETGFNLTIGIMIPEEDIMSLINKNNSIIFFVSFLLIMASLFVSVFMSRAISEPLRILTAEAEKIKNLDFDSEEKINTSLSEINKIKNSFEDMKEGLRSFKKDIQSNQVDKSITPQKETVIKDEKRNITIFFSDIPDFTAISEQLSLEKLIENLRVYFKGMNSPIVSNSGIIDKYIGGAIMAFWGTSNYIENHSTLACISALKCQTFLKELASEWKNENQPIFKTHIGINTGEVIVGNIEYEEKFNYTVLGDNVNLASRLEGLNKFYGTKIIISETTYQQAKDFIEVRKLDLVAVKGKSKGVNIYQLISEKDNIQKSTKCFLNLYEEGFNSYLKREWQKAIKIFQETFRLTKFTDKASKMLLDRCKEYLKNPPNENWNGVYTFHEK